MLMWCRYVIVSFFFRRCFTMSGFICDNWSRICGSTWRRFLRLVLVATCADNCDSAVTKLLVWYFRFLIQTLSSWKKFICTRRVRLDREHTCTKYLNVRNISQNAVASSKPDDLRNSLVHVQWCAPPPPRPQRGPGARYGNRRYDGHGDASPAATSPAERSTRAWKASAARAVCGFPSGPPGTVAPRPTVSDVPCVGTAGTRPVREARARDGSSGACGRTTRRADDALSHDRSRHGSPYIYGRGAVRPSEGRRGGSRRLYPAVGLTSRLRPSPPVRGKMARARESVSVVAAMGVCESCALWCVIAYDE